jgi:hypothetical protein
MLMITAGIRRGISYWLFFLAVLAAGFISPPVGAMPSPTPLPSTFDSSGWEAVWRFPWGKEEGECGLWTYSPGDDECLQGHPNCGPRSFAVEETGGVMLLDTVNRRVNRYDAEGQFLYSFPASPHNVDIAVEGEDVYLLSSSEQMLRVYERSGKFREEVRLPDDEGIYVELYPDGKRLGARSNKGIYREIPRVGETRLAARPLLAPDGAHNYRLIHRAEGAELLIEGGSKGLRSAEIFSERPLSRVRFLTSISQGPILEIDQFCTLEEAGELRERARDKRYSEARLYSNTGALLATVKLPDRDDTFTLFERRSQYRDGWLYLMYPREEAVYFYRRRLDKATDRDINEAEVGIAGQ